MNEAVKVHEAPAEHQDNGLPPGDAKEGGGQQTAGGQDSSGAERTIYNGPTDPHGFGQHVPPVTLVGPFVIGFVEEIHGEMGRPCPEYMPTKAELLVLAAPWARQLHDIEAWWAASEQVGSSEMRQREYSYDRIAKIASLVGGQETDAVVLPILRQDENREE